MTIAELLLPEFDQEMAATRKVLERVPDETLAWKPHDKSFSMGNLASHIANMVTWTVDTMNRQEFDLASVTPAELNRAAKNRAELLSWFDANVKAARTAMDKPDAEYMVPWTLKNGAQVFFTMPRYNCVRSFCLNHIVHHRAQLGVYLRLNNIPVPGVYGPSADEGN
ncbi:MAG TPA: DinB family protein [Vicinamibacterales bacterium]|nr:DinB family protein [Vicinamibacterales bacterium]